MSWSFHPAAALADVYREAWQNLNRNHHHDHPLLDAKFVVALYEQMGNPDVLLAVREEDSHITALLLVEQTARCRWQTFMPAQGCICPMLIDPDRCGTSAAGLAAELLAALPGHAGMLDLLMVDPKYSPLSDEPQTGLTERVKYGTTTCIETRDFDQYWASRKRRLRRAIPRLLRKAQRDGISHVLSEIRDPDEIAPAIAEYSRLESEGWKGEEGTSLRDNRQAQFYERVLTAFAGQRQACIYQLRFDGILVASLLTVQQNRVLVVLKTAFDESHALYAPGRLIDYLMIQSVCRSDEIDIIENYMRATQADLRWSTGSRELVHLNCYRSSLVKSAVRMVRKARLLRAR